MVRDKGNTEGNRESSFSGKNQLEVIFGGTEAKIRVMCKALK